MTTIRFHPEVLGAWPRWERCRDVYQGADAVKDAGTIYLPRLSGQDWQQYESYKRRAAFYNAMYRTVQGLSGLIFSKEPEFESGDKLQEFSKDVSQGGQSLFDFSLSMVDQTLITGRVGLLVDFPTLNARNDVSGTSVARPNPTVVDIERAQARPKWVDYWAEDIVTWKADFVNNKYRLTRVILRERYDVEGTDEFDVRYNTRFRVCELNEDNVYQQRIYESQPDRAQGMLVSTPISVNRALLQTYMQGVEQVGDPIIILVQGKPINFIPFWFLQPANKGVHVQKPPLLDLVELNLNHYQLKADQYHGMHYTALPTPYMFGIDDDHKPTTLGPAKWITSPEYDVKAGLLEYQGKGLQEFTTECDRLEFQMAASGARILAPDNVQNETALAAGIRNIGETSILGNIVLSISEQLFQALKFTEEWMGESSSETVFKMNTDFMPFPLKAQELLALVQSWQQGAISYDTLIENLQRGEIVRMTITPEEERKRIEANPPPAQLEDNTQDVDDGNPEDGAEGAQAA